MCDRSRATCRAAFHHCTAGANNNDHDDGASDNDYDDGASDYDDDDGASNDDYDDGASNNDYDHDYGASDHDYDHDYGASDDDYDDGSSLGRSKRAGRELPFAQPGASRWPCAHRRL
jgi:hypothetical protein